MNARLPRRVRTDGTVRRYGDRWGNVGAFLRIEYPRIVSTCANRRPLWEWRTDAAVEVAR